MLLSRLWAEMRRQLETWKRSALVTKASAVLTQHPRLSWGGGAGVIFLFALSLELTGPANRKIWIASAVCYFVALLVLWSGFNESEFFKNYRKRAWLFFVLITIGTITLWYGLLPRAIIQPTAKDPPSAKDVASEVVKQLDSRILPKVTPSPSASPSPTVSLAPNTTPLPSASKSDKKRRRQPQRKKEPCSWENTLLGKC